MISIAGLYKFIRKYLNPDRKLNNDLVDFISRIPDNEVWVSLINLFTKIGNTYSKSEFTVNFVLQKDWQELSVPEPLQCGSPDNKLARSFSDNPPDYDVA